MENKKTALGLDENVEGLLCYTLGVITGIVFLVLEKENKFVRFHAMQSLATFLGLFIVSMVIWMDSLYWGDNITFVRSIRILPLAIIDV